MIIDDSDSDLLYGRFVVERSGIALQVTTQESAREALVFLQQPAGADVDMIFLDINMPGMNGFEFLQAFEALARGDRPPAPVVVMLTSSPDPHDRARAFAFRSVRDYLVKPITVAETQRMVQRLLAAGGSHG